MLRLAIIEDDKQVANMLSLYFEAEEDFETVFLADSAESIPYGRVEKTDVVLCDIGLPGKSGVEIAWKIKQESPKTQIVMFTVFEDEEKIFQSLQAGASGYLLKNTPLPQIREGLLDVVNGKAAISPIIAKKVIDYFNYAKKGKDVSVLTAREFDVLTHVKSGHSNKQVADKLCISPDTVKFHIKNIYGKLRVKSRSELFGLC